MIEAHRRPKLTDVTLVAVTSVAIPATIDAIRASVRQVDFAEVLLLSDRQPPNLEAPITWRPIERLASRHDYSCFMLKNLAKHIRTSHALCIQWDGFVLDGRAWQPRFLDYDYIGAPWPHFTDGYNVGNGGFSLRSLRLLEACANLPASNESPEDLVIARLCRPHLEAMGIRFPAQDLAQEFSYERTKPTGREFGFHGAFNLFRHLSTSEITRTLKSLEPGMLARNERWELLRWALTNGKPSLAMTVLRRLV